MEKMRDSIDFSSENIPALYRKVLYPTLLGMLAAVSYTIADGIFVGQGVGSDALAAINIAAPLFLISSGLALRRSPLLQPQRPNFSSLPSRSFSRSIPCAFSAAPTR